MRFFTELLRDQRLAVGRLDSRFTGPLGRATRRQWDADPSPRRDRRSLRRSLEPLRARRAGLRERPALCADLAEATRGVVLQGVRGQAGRRRPKLARAMRANPHLQVHIAYGYHDGATPYYGAQDVVAHLQIPAVAARQHRARLLRGRPHDVRPRAEPAAAVPRPRGLRAARRRLSLASRHLRVLPGGPWGDTSGPPASSQGGPMSKKSVGRHQRQPIPRRHIATAILGVAVAVVAVSAIALGVAAPSAGGTPGESREGSSRPHLRPVLLPPRRKPRPRAPPAPTPPGDRPPR